VRAGGQVGQAVEWFCHALVGQQTRLAWAAVSCLPGPVVLGLLSLPACFKLQRLPICSFCGWGWPFTQPPLPYSTCPRNCPQRSPRSTPTCPHAPAGRKYRSPVPRFAPTQYLLPAPPRLALLDRHSCMHEAGMLAMTRPFPSLPRPPQQPLPLHAAPLKASRQHQPSPVPS
jgi:hypothetical protein